MAVVSSVLAAEQSEITFDSSPATLVQTLQGARSTPSMVATISQTHSTRSAVISKTSSTHSRIGSNGGMVEPMVEPTPFTNGRMVSSGLAAEQSLITFSSSPATLVQSMTGLLSAGKADAMLMEATMTASKITKAPFILRPLVGMTRNTQKMF